MKWQDCAGSYKAFISLGSTCQTAYQLRRLGLRNFSGPLDWFISRSVPDVTRLIRHRFNGFMELDRLRLTGTDTECYVVIDEKNDVVSYHDFSRSLPPYRWAEAYPDFKQKMDRRVKAFLHAAKRQPVCLVRIQTSKAEAHQLHGALKKVMSGSFRLLIVNNEDGLHEIRHEDWGLPGVASVSVPSGMDWRGSDLAWDRIMQGFKLRQGV